MNETLGGAAERLRAFWAGYRELHERQALLQRPWEEEFLHWSPDGREWRLHGHRPPPGARAQHHQRRVVPRRTRYPGRGRSRRVRPAWGLLGVPTSAGSHNAGQDKAPTALRSAGLLTSLAQRGLTVHDYGDLPPQVHRPAPKVDGVRDLERVAGIAGQVRETVAAIAADGRRPLVVGGDCTITLGVVAGLGPDLGLLYFDGDADLSLPADDGSGILDTMGVSHLLGDGTAELAGLGGSAPLVSADRLELLGFDPEELGPGHWARLVTKRLSATPVDAVRADPAGATAAAVQRLAAYGRFLLHVDVDVLDTGAFPLANFPHFNGLTLAEAAGCLEVAAASPALAGVVLTEVNPDHDPDGNLIADLVEVVAGALAPASTPSG